MTGREGLDRLPIMRLGDCLLISIQVELEDHMVVNLKDDLTERIVRTGARGVLIDVSALDIIDSFIGRMLGNMAAMARVLDAVTVIVGMQPAVAVTLVELGLALDGVGTALDVDRGLALIRKGTAGALRADGAAA